MFLSVLRAMYAEKLPEPLLKNTMRMELTVGYLQQV